MSKQACAEDDPRLSGFPCSGNHVPKTRQNQHATWSCCTRCGLRLNYVPKKNMEGQFRHMGPHPNLTRLALEEIAKTTPAHQVSERMVTGKLMELKGVQLQKGLTETQAINMKYKEYLERMGMSNPENDARLSKTKTKGYMDSKTLEETLLSATKEYVETHGLDQLDPNELAQTVRAAASKAASKAAAKTKIKKEPVDMATASATASVMTISDEEDDVELVPSKTKEG